MWRCGVWSPTDNPSSFSRNSVVVIHDSLCLHIRDKDVEFSKTTGASLSGLQALQLISTQSMLPLQLLPAGQVAPHSFIVILILATFFHSHTTMRTSQVLFWLGLAFVHQRVDGLPATFSIDARWDKSNPTTVSAGYHPYSRADAKFARDLVLCSDLAPKKGGRPPKAPIVVPVPQTPAGKGTGQIDTPGSPSSQAENGTNALPQTPTRKTLILATTITRL